MVLGFAAALFALSACGWAPAPPEPSPASPPAPPAHSAQPGVLLVVVDTLRADRLGCYGADRPGISPRIDALAASGQRFTHAISPAAWTVPAVASLLTGQHPEAHGVLRFRAGESIGQDVLDPRFDTLAERFQAAGYRTGALLKTGVVSEDHGMAQGFDHFAVVPGATASGRSAEELTDAALRWVAQNGGQPWFLYAHYMDPHTPYAAPPPRRYAPEGADGGHARVRAYKRGERTPTPADRAELLALYDEEVSYVDAQIGRLIDGLPAGTVLALTADHGEQLGEHGGWLHEHLWEENVAVPLIFSGPGVVAGEVRGPVSTVHVGATLLGLAGLPGELGVGRSLASEGDRGPVRSVYAEADAIWQGSNKRIADARLGAPKVFDLGVDPGELVDLAGVRLDLARALAEAAEAARPVGHVAGVAPVGGEAVKGLEALGYLE